MSQSNDYDDQERQNQDLLNEQVTEIDMQTGEIKSNQGELFSALSKCQGEIAKIARSATADTGKFSYSYSTIGEILDAARKPLADNGLAIVQMPTMFDNIVSVTTILTHEKGGQLLSTLNMPLVIPTNANGQAAMNEAQACGSIITYARRYQLAGFLAISQEDSDAHGSSKGGSSKKASAKQIKFVRDLVQQQWNVADFREKFGVKAADELTSSQAKEAIDYIQGMNKPAGPSEQSSGQR